MSQRRGHIMRAVESTSRQVFLRNGEAHITGIKKSLPMIRRLTLNDSSRPRTKKGKLPFVPARLMNAQLDKERGDTHNVFS